MNRHCSSNEALSAYLDGELGGKPRAEFERHLAACPLCREALHNFQCLRACFQSLPHQEIGYDLAPTLLDGAKPRAAPAWRHRCSLWQLLPTTFAAAATISLGIFLGTSLVGTPDAGAATPPPSLAMFDLLPPGSVCVGSFAGCYPEGKI